MEGNSLTPPANLPQKRKYGYQKHQQQEQHWMTPEISAQLQACNQLRKTSEATGKAEDQKAYQAQCQKVHGMIEESKSSLGLGQLPAFPSAYGYGWHQQSGYGYNGYQQRGPWENGNFQHPSGNQYQGDQRKVFTCTPCNRSFYSKRKLDEHVKEHENCPFPECKFSGHMKVLDQHINNQHMLVNFAALQIDDETWVAERKKRFPSAQRAELRRAEQMEKLKRGEKLGITKKPFKSKIKSIISKTNEENQGQSKSKNEHKSDIVKKGNEKDHNKNIKDKEGKYDKDAKDNPAGKEGEQTKREARDIFKRRERREKRQRQQSAFSDAPSTPIVAVDLLESDDETRDGLCAFKGTKCFYEEIGEVSYFGNKVMGMDDDDDDDDDDPNEEEKIAISDDEEWEVDKKEEPAQGPLTLGGALGSLMGAYSDSEDEEVATPPANQVKDEVQPLPKKCQENPSSEGAANTSIDIAKTQNTDQDQEIIAPQRTRKKMVRKNKPKGPPKQRKMPRRRKTLLERLLQPDIIHERNVILQCVRFIVGNNFFVNDSKNASGKKGEDENKTKEEDKKSCEDKKERSESKKEVGKKDCVIDKEDNQSKVEVENEEPLGEEGDQSKMEVEGKDIKVDEKDEHECKNNEKDVECIKNESKIPDIIHPSEIINIYKNGNNSQKENTANIKMAHQKREWKNAFVSEAQQSNKKAAKQLKKALLADDGMATKRENDESKEEPKVEVNGSELNGDTCEANEEESNTKDLEKNNENEGEINDQGNGEDCNEQEKMNNVVNEENEGEEIINATKRKNCEREIIDNKEEDKEVENKKIKLNDVTVENEGN